MKTYLRNCLLAFIVIAAVVFTGCKGPSKATLQKLANAGQSIAGALMVNVSLPEELRAANLLDAAGYEKFKKGWDDFGNGLGKFNDVMATLLSIEKPNLASLAPIVADLVAQLRTLQSLAASKILTGIEISLRVIGTYFAMHVQHAKALGLTVDKVIQMAGFKADQQGRASAELLTTWSFECLTSDWVEVGSGQSWSVEPAGY